MTPVAEPTTLFEHPVLHGFHPAVRAWFMERFPDGPTPPQLGGWPAIAAGQDTLIAAPTGSGKTLSGFLVGIDRLYRAHASPAGLGDQLSVVYISPLRALAVDIKENLERPLTEIAAMARRMGLDPPDVKVGVRTGDTTTSGRAALVRKPPHLLVTTPESLYLLLTAPRSRQVLAGVSTVIIDEIHALARDKRGSHLALSLERLEHVAVQRPVRVGLSATQRPIETVARLLVGSRDAPDGAGPACTIVDTGHRRQLDLALELPGAELEAIASAAHMADALDRIAELVEGHRTTLVFVNTRSLAERVAHLLGERLGDDVVAAHHGSLSKERRLRVETRLRAGELRALVATASLELGIDVGPVDLVCQLGTPRSLATFLQRVGRSGHNRYGIPKGRIFPLTRDELIECSALLIGVGKGRLDAIEPPHAPLDILAQQIVAEAATERWQLDALYALFRRAAPYRDLSRDVFDRVVELTATGVATGRGPRGDHIHLDRINGEVSGRRGARLAAVTSGGAIPELADYRVLADPDDMLVGTVNEEWAVESNAGDIFLLGTHSWRIRRIEPGVVRVVDAGGAPPTVPFWRGEAPGRTRELSEEVSDLRAVVDGHLATGDAAAARRWLTEQGLPDAAAVQILAYLAATRAALGLVPTRDQMVVERFFDESGGMQLVVHSPYGARINRGLGLALRKRFCVTFDFELQAAASDDAVVLSLGPQHSFALDQVARFLRADTVEGVLCQAVLVPPSPMFVARWRWNLNRALVVLRWKAGRKHPPALQRMEADDVMATAFPQAAACQENVSGPLEIPDHPLVTQTMHDTLTEAMDLPGLQALLARIEGGAVVVHSRDTVEASPMSHEILVGKPYTFLDDAEAADRRTRMVALRRGLAPVALEEVGGLDPAAIARVEQEVAPDPRDADELHDVLMALVLCAPCPAWQAWFDQLRQAGRAGVVTAGDRIRWCATERLAMAAALQPDAPELGGVTPADESDAAAQAVRGLLDQHGPLFEAEIAQHSGVRAGLVAMALAALEAEGFAIRGNFRPAPSGEQWCARRVLARIHAASQQRRRRGIEPANAQQFMRFLLRWQHVHPATRLRGPDALLEVVEQLQGWHCPAAAWETGVLPTRIEGYRPDELDRLGHAGLLSWGCLAPRNTPVARQDGGDERDDAAAGDGAPRRASRVMALTLCTRADIGWLLTAARSGGTGDASIDDRYPGDATATGPLADVIAALHRHGARFLRELAADCGRPDTVIEAALWDGVARGLLTADSFWALRSLFATRPAGAAPALTDEIAGTTPARVPAAAARPTRGRLRRGAAGARLPGEGRWALLPAPLAVDEPDELAEAVVEQLLCRWGVVFRDLAVREQLGLPWRELQWALRRLEARGTVRGGRFVTGFAGEQYALPEAVDALDAVRTAAPDGIPIVISAADPLNLTGVITPGRRVPALATRTITYIDGLPHETVAPERSPDPGPRSEPVEAEAVGAHHHLLAARAQLAAAGRVRARTAPRMGRR